MAISRRTLRLSNELRIVISGIADRYTRQLVQAWARAWGQIEAEWLAAINDLIEVGDGQWPTRAQIRRAARAQRALALATREVIGLTEMTGVHVVTAAREVTDDVAEWQARLIASQMPPAAGDTAELVTHFTRIDPNAIGAIVERTTEQVTALTRPLPQATSEAMLQALVRGVALGHNPRLAARQMLKQVEGQFNGGLTRALTIARTEILDAHRSGAAAAHFANDDVLSGWVWQAQLDKRTCPSCWAMHGSEHPLTQIGPNDHQQGRCARLPKLKTWKELGFAIREPASLLPDAQVMFAGLSDADQLAVMGPSRLHALRTGLVSWNDLTTVRHTTGWRDSHVPTPVRRLRRKALRVV